MPLYEVAKELYRELAEYKTKYNKLKDFIEEKVEDIDEYWERKNNQEHTNQITALVEEKIEELKDEFPPDPDNAKMKDIVDRVFYENYEKKH